MHEVIFISFKRREPTNRQKFGHLFPYTCQTIHSYITFRTAGQVPSFGVKLRLQLPAKRAQPKQVPLSGVGNDAENHGHVGQK